MQLPVGTDPVGLSSLCVAFRERAAATWDWIEIGERTKIRPGEETLTDMNLLELQNSHANKIFCRKFSKHEEGRTTGADWEWWIGARGGWVGARVQAKKLSVPSGVYEKLDHSSKNGRQVDLLIGDSFGMYPIYCFYNAFDGISSGVPWNCGSFPPDTNQLGCAIAGAPAIKAFIDTGVKDLASVLTVSRPWSCLVCCVGYGGVTLAERAASVLSVLVGDDGDRPILGTLPVQFGALLAGETVAQPDVSGVLVITDQSITEVF